MGVSGPVRVVVDVTNSTIDPANPGVIRVARRFSRELQQVTNPLFVVWDIMTNSYVLPTRQEHERLSRFTGPLLTGEDRLSPAVADRIGLEETLARLGSDQPWLLCAETLTALRCRLVRPYARRLGMALGAIFFDAIPVLRPELCNAEIRINHRDYMIGLAEFDLVIPISRYSADCLRQFWQHNGLCGARLMVNSLPGEFGGTVRGLPGPGPSHPVSILCVSTLEPRKNHRRLIEACLRLQAKRRDLDWCLTLVGDRYAGAPELAEYIEQVAKSQPRVRWLGVVDDDTLGKLYSESSFTVYPSTIEGFGMPIVESIWHARPCLCSNQGVMAELAADGGCMTANVEDTADLSEAIGRLIEDSDLRNRLSREASERQLKSWQEYTGEFWRILDSVPSPTPHPFVAKPARPEIPAWFDSLSEELRADPCPIEDFERLALRALLTRAQPTCAVQAGTHCGNFLTLIARYSKLVFSIDTDPDAPPHTGYISNVSYLTGGAQQLLRILFRELESAGIPVNLVLIDGAGSAESFRQCISLVFQYVPREPMFLLMHDGSNAGCRQAMLEASWQDSAYCHFVDLDFVPGLGMAYFSPKPRNGKLSFT